jgi:phosphoethanolamine N-methyltransferase
VGTAYVDKNIRTWEAMQTVLDSGEHRPTHLRGRKPGEVG